MKKHVLTVAVLAALGARAVLAASEGGDTYSAIQDAQRLPHSVPQPAMSPRSEATTIGADAYGPEGFETWSHVLAQRHTLVHYGNNSDRAASSNAISDASVEAPSGGSEGGDTFSRFIPPSHGRAVGTGRLASLPPR